MKKKFGDSAEEYPQLIDWEQDHEEHEESILHALPAEKEHQSSEVASHVQEYHNALKQMFLSKIEVIVHDIKEENFDKMANGKLLKKYLSLESYNQRLALVQEYHRQYFSTAVQYQDLNNHQEAHQGLLYFIFKIMVIESQHLSYATKHTNAHLLLGNLTNCIALYVKQLLNPKPS